MVRTIGILFGFQLAGECVSWSIRSAVPGPIIGLVLLLAWLHMRRAATRAPYHDVETTELGRTVMPMLRNLAFLFVAPGVGVLEHADLLLQHAIGVAAVLLLSTLAALAATALVFAASQRIAQRTAGRRAATGAGARRQGALT